MKWIAFAGLFLTMLMTNAASAQTEQPIATTAEVVPAYIDGQDKLAKTIASSIVNPQTNHITGTIYVSFVVETNGTVSTPKIEQSVPGALSIEKGILDAVMNKLGTFTPAMNGGIPVRFKVILPVQLT